MVLDLILIFEEGLRQKLAPLRELKATEAVQARKGALRSVRKTFIVVLENDNDSNTDLQDVE